MRAKLKAGFPHKPKRFAEEKAHKTIPLLTERYALGYYWSIGLQCIIESDCRSASFGHGKSDVERSGAGDIGIEFCTSEVDGHVHGVAEFYGNDVGFYY